MNEEFWAKHPLAIIYAGGQFFPLREHAKGDVWIKELLKVGVVTFSDTAFMTRDPFPKGIAHLARTAQNIFSRWDRYHGFIIILERTNFLYFAALLSFMLGRVNKTVAFSCPPGDTLAVEEQKYSDVMLRASLVNAVLTASGKKVGTIITVGSELIPATHAIFFQQFDDIGQELVEGMMSADTVNAGWIHFGLQREPAIQKLAPVPATPQLHCAIADDVPLLYMADYSTPDALRTILPDIAIIKSTMRTTLHREPLAKQKIILLLEPESLMLAHDGVWTTIHWMTEETARAKFVWLLAQRKEKAFAAQHGTNIAKLMRKDFIGETLQSIPPSAASL